MHVDEFLVGQLVNVHWKIPSERFHAPDDLTLQRLELLSRCIRETLLLSFLFCRIRFRFCAPFLSCIFDFEVPVSMGFPENPNGAQEAPACKSI